jgi:hypothetical protein
VIRHSLLSLGASLALLGAVAPVAAQPAANAPPAPARGFNPKISLILVGTYAQYGAEAEPDVAGVVLGPETEFRPEGFSLGETELVVEANVDDQFHGWATVALENEDGETVVAVEEAYFNTLALPWGFAAKGGRFFSDIGYLNRIHAHAWEFVDAPMVYRTLLAGQVNDDGVQLRWVAPTDVFFELGVEVLRGQEFPGGGADRSGARSFSAFSHFGGDVGASHAWRAGLSHLAADANDRRTGEDVATSFSGDSDVRILDVVYKWAPQGNPAQTNFVLHAEFFYREEEGELVFNPDAGPTSSAYEGRQKGLYVQTVYQFMPRWRAGLRYDRMEEADNEIPNNPAGEFDALLDASYAPQRYSAMVDFSNSEFSRLRVQYNRDETRPAGEEDDQFFLQYIMSIGSHPAHQF